MTHHHSALRDGARIKHVSNDGAAEHNGAQTRRISQSLIRGCIVGTEAVSLRDDHSVLIFGVLLLIDLFIHRANSSYRCALIGLYVWYAADQLLTAVPLLWLLFLDRKWWQLLANSSTAHRMLVNSALELQYFTSYIELHMHIILIRHSGVRSICWNNSFCSSFCLSLVFCKNADCLASCFFIFNPALVLPL